jgi:hypothetical protein
MKALTLLVINAATNVMYSLVEVAGVTRLVIKVIDWGDAIQLPPRQAAAGAQGQQPAAAAAPAIPAVLTSKNTCRHLGEIKIS